MRGARTQVPSLRYLPMSMNSESTPSRRFAGLDRLYGAGACARLARAHVCVVGVGGVGSWAVEALARCGVGTLTLIDADHVVESNVNRQVQALTENLGKAKITALRERIAQIHPDCVVHEVDDFIDEDNLELIPASADVVLDCADQLKAKRAMIVFCQQRKQALLTCGASGGKTDATRIVQTDLAYTVQDPILAKIRQQLRRSARATAAGSKPHTPRKKTPSKMHVPVLYSDEAVRYPELAQSCAVELSDPANPSDLSTTSVAPQGLNCAGFGSSVMVTASFGMAAAQWAVAQILAQ